MFDEALFHGYTVNYPELRRYADEHLRVLVLPCVLVTRY